MFSDGLYSKISVIRPFRRTPLPPPPRCRLSVGRVRGGNEARFVGRRAEGDAAFQHAVEEMFETIGIRTRHVGVVLRHMIGKIQPEQSALAVGGKRHACFGRGRSENL